MGGNRVEEGRDRELAPSPTPPSIFYLAFFISLFVVSASLVAEHLSYLHYILTLVMHIQIGNH